MLPAPGSEPAEQPALTPQPYTQPAQQPALAPQPYTRPAEEQPALAPQPYTQPAQQPAPTPQPYAQPAPQPYERPVPAPQPYAQPAPQPYERPVPAPQPYAQPAPQPYAQPAPPQQPYAQPGVQPIVNWTLQVIRDGQIIDSFDGATAIGQTRTDMHHRAVTHDIGCKDQPAASIDLQRTIAVTPLRADPTGAVFAIDARETVESDSASSTPEGCKLPPHLSQVHATHPGLVVPAGQWGNWQIVNQDPALLYRVRASLAQP